MEPNQTQFCVEAIPVWGKASTLLVFLTALIKYAGVCLQEELYGENQNTVLKIEEKLN